MEPLQELQKLSESLSERDIGAMCVAALQRSRANVRDNTFSVFHDLMPEFLPDLLRRTNSNIEQRVLEPHFAGVRAT